MKKPASRPSAPQALPPNIATVLPVGYVESQHQMTGEPYVPGAVPTKPAPGAPGSGSSR
jgi:hypothetical protein